MRTAMGALLIFLLLPFGEASGEQEIAPGYVWQPPSQFVVTVRALYLKNNTGQWIKVVEPDKEVDLYSEQAKVSFFNHGRIPAGNYINFKLVILETVRVSETDGFGNKTRSGGRAVLSGSARDNTELPGRILSYEETSPTWNEESEGSITAVLDFDNRDADDIIELTKKVDFARPFEIKNGSFIHVTVALDLLGICRKVNPSVFARGVPRKRSMVVFPPKQVEEARFTVDGRTDALAPADVLIQF